MPPSPHDPVSIPSSPVPPFPLKLSGKVIAGFGRGSKELGIPTANIPIEGLSVGGHEDVESGIYFGWAGLEVDDDVDDDDDDQGKGHVSGGGGDGGGDGYGDGDEHLGQRQVPPRADDDGEPEPKPPHEPTRSAAFHAFKPQVKTYAMVMSIGWNPFYKNSVRSVEVHLLHAFARDFYGAHLNLVVLGFIRPERDYGSVDALVEDIHRDIAFARRALALEGYERWRGDEFLLRSGGGEEVGR